MAREGVRYRISSDFDNKGVKAAEKGLLAFGKSALKATIGITSASIAVAKLNRFLKESTQAALSDQKAVASLNKTLANSGFGMAAEQVSQFIDAAQMATGVTEDSLRPAFISLFNAVGSVTKAERLLNVALDVSAATGRDVTSVTAAFGKAALGSNTAIQRLGLGISKAELASADFNDIMAKLERKFKGTAAAAADTMGGKFDRMRIAVAEAKEEVGKGLLDAFDTLAREGGQDIDTLQRKIVDLGTSVGDFARGLGVITARLKEIGSTQVGQGSIFDAIKTFIPFAAQIDAVLGKVVDLGAEQRRNAQIGRGGSYFTYRAGQLQMEQQKRLEKLAEERRKKEEAARKAAAAAAAAAKRADEAQKKKQAAMDKAIAEKAITYDTERVALQAALSKTTDAATRKRLTDLLAINAATYAEDLQLTSIKDLLTLINEEMKKYTQATDDTGKGIGAWVTSLTNVETALKSATVAASGLTSEFGSAARAASTIPVAGVGAVIRGPQAPTIPDAYIPPVAATAAAAAVDAIKQTLPAVTAAVMQELPVGNVSPESLPAAGPSFIDRQVSSQIAEALPVVNVVVQGSVIAETDLATAVGEAVNRYTRSGGRLSPVAV